MQQHSIVTDKFNEVWKNDKRGYFELVNKMQDENYIVHEPEHDNAMINMVNRAVMTNRYILEHFKPGSTIMDVASGNGFESCYLAGRGYKVTGFDVAQSGIEFSKSLATELGVSVDFVFGDHNVLSKYDTGSFDVVCALGFTRYLEKDARDYFYKESYRILKPSGVLCVSNDNQLFDMFALNDLSLIFWADMIKDFSPVVDLLPGKRILEIIKEHVKVPVRTFTKRSVSKFIKRHFENPLAYSSVVAPFGFKIDKIVYPDCHLMPPFLQNIVDQEKLEAIRNNICLKRSEHDWRAMFFGFEFLSFLKKQ